MSTKIILCAVLVAVFAVAFSFSSKLLPKTIDRDPAPSHPTETMMAVVYQEHGDVSVMEYTAVPKPVPKPTQYLIRVEASALNPVDFKMRRSADMPQFLLPLPNIPGADMAGVVVEAPKDGKFEIGDRVAAMMPVLSKWGSHAEYAAVEESFLAKIKGENIDFVQAASYPLAGLTVLQNFANLQDPPQAGDKLLVHAGAGGVGTFAIQYGAALLQMKVATTASAPKADLLKELGAEIVVDYRTQQFEEVLKDYDVVLDPMSWLYEERTLNTGVLKSSGHYLNIPSSDSQMINGVERANGIRTYTNAALSKLQNLVSPGSTPKYGLVFVDPNGEDMRKVLDLMENNIIRAVIDRKYHISEAVEAYRYLEEGHATGKVVLYHGEKKVEDEPEEEAQEEATEAEEEARESQHVGEEEAIVHEQ